MYLKITSALGSALLFAALSQPSFARGKTSSGATQTVTGCVAQGDEPNEYSIKADDGKTYGLKSAKVDLAKHMGHKVTVTGSVTAAKEKNKVSKSGVPEEDMHMKVNDLKMVSTTCQ